MKVIRPPKIAKQEVQHLLDLPAIMQKANEAHIMAIRAIATINALE
jgi:hypothetical protein